MGDTTAISWTDHTWNPWAGCTRVSPACDHCYAADQTARYGYVAWGAGQPRRRTSAATWREPAKWERQAAATGQRHRVFCASWADVFDTEVDPAWRADLWQVIRATPHLDWQLLTKRPNLIRRNLPPDWGDGWPHVWLGATVELAAYTWRIDHLLAVPAAVRFLSCEPLLEPLDLAPYLATGGLHWVIAGGESGPRARPLDLAHVRALRDQCRAAGAAFFFKQIGGRTPNAGGCLLDGQEWKEWPASPLAS